MDEGRKQTIINAAVWLCAGAVAGCICTLLCLRGAGANTDGAGAAQQISRAAEYSKQTRAAVKSAAGAVGRAEQHADRAEQLNQRAQAGAADSKKLVEQLRADNQRAKQIIDELIGNAQARAAQDAAR